MLFRFSLQLHLNLSVVKEEIIEFKIENDELHFFRDISVGRDSTQEKINIYIKNRSGALNQLYIERFTFFENYLVSTKPTKILSDKDEFGIYLTTKISDELNTAKSELYSIGINELKHLKNCIYQALDVATSLEILVNEANKIENQAMTKDEISKNLVKYCVILPEKISLIKSELEEHGHLFFETFFDKKAYYRHFGC